jgi:hypothetical protein
MNARKQDTRRKIELGGLVVKAGLDTETKAVVFGALVLAAAALEGQNAPTNRARFAAAGDAAFNEDSP